MRTDARAMMVALTEGGTLAVLGCMSVMLLALAATLSRSGLIALVVAVLAGTSLSQADRKRVVWSAAVVTGALVPLLVWMNAEGFAERVITSVSAQQVDAVGRLTIWKETLHIVRTFPLLGTGVGTFADAMFAYQRTGRAVLFNHAHNEYLQIATEGGILMLSLVFCGLILLARAAWRTLTADMTSYRFLRAGACAGLVAIAVQSIWETGLRAPANLALAGVLAGMALAARGNTGPERAGV